MSEHTKGRLSVEYQGFGYGYDLDTEDRATLAEDLSEANARRLAASWNALEFLRTEQIEAATASRDHELIAARALLREVLESNNFDSRLKLYAKVQNYLDVCDTMGDGNG